MSRNASGSQPHILRGPKFKPLGKMVLLRPLAAPSLASGLQVVTHSQPIILQGTILSTGPDVRDRTIGQTVLFNRMQATYLELDEKLVLIPEEGCVAYVED